MSPILIWLLVLSWWCTIKAQSVGTSFSTVCEASSVTAGARARHVQAAGALAVDSFDLAAACREQ
ncbi:hypothetical protein CLAFUR0_20001, partial [Fulvia fulva]